MNLENIRKELLRLSALVEGWGSDKPVNALERDLALEKLRDVYEAIRFPESAADTVAVRTEDVTAESPAVQKPEDSLADSADLDLSGMLALEPDFAPIASEEFAVPADATDTAEPEELVLPVQHREEPQPAAAAIVPPQEPEPVSAPVATFVTQQEPETISLNPAPAPESESEPEPEPEPEPEHLSVSNVEMLAKPRSEAVPAEQGATLFEVEEEDDTTRHRRKQRVILSLYGDGKTSRKSDSDEKHGMFEEVTVKTVASDDPVWVSGTATEKKVSVTEQEAAPNATTASTPAPASGGSVLGEVINHDVRTLSDTIEPPHDMASSLRRKTAISDLRQAIGINDKFLLIRDLFDGDGAAYEVAMQVLNDAESLDDCMIYLTENYAWNADSDGVRLLMDLLERKFA